jgi:biotin operon repressor
MSISSHQKADQDNIAIKSMVFHTGASASKSTQKPAQGGTNEPPGRTRVDFAIARKAFLDPAKRNPDFAVAYEIAQGFNFATFVSTGQLVSWLSLRAIGKELGISKNAVQLRVDRLETAGLLAVETGHQPVSTRYYAPLTYVPPIPGNRDISQQPAESKSEPAESTYVPVPKSYVPISETYVPPIPANQLETLNTGLTPIVPWVVRGPCEVSKQGETEDGLTRASASSPASEKGPADVPDPSTIVALVAVSFTAGSPQFGRPLAATHGTGQTSPSWISAMASTPALRPLPSTPLLALPNG